MKQPEEKKVFFTTDGAHFPDQAKAFDHEEDLEIVNLFGIAQSDFYPSSVVYVSELIEKKHKLREILNHCIDPQIDGP